MPSPAKCNVLRKTTGSVIEDRIINIQYEAIDRSDKLLLIKALNKTLKMYSVTIETGWEILKDVFDKIALEYLLDPATAYGIYLDWKDEQVKRNNVIR